MDDIDEGPLTFSEDWAQILGQDEFWIDASGTRLDLDEMDVDHCINVARWIVRALPRLAERDLWRMAMGPGPTGDMACDAFDAEMNQMERVVADPAGWADQMPLMQALKRRARGQEAREVGTVATGGRTYVRTPKEVLAVQYDGVNIEAVQDFVNSPYIRVEEKPVSGPGTCRGMVRVLSVWSVNFAVTVPVNGWLLTDEDAFWSLSDDHFRNEYQEKR